MKKFLKKNVSVVLITSSSNKKIINLIRRFKKNFNIKIINSKNKKSINYFEKNYKKYNYLISYLSGYLIKKKQLDFFESKKRINFHPGTPNYRGRDTHHFASFNGEKTYGSTLHFLDAKIDNGKIISIKKFNISKNSNYEKYFNVANNAAEYLFKKYFLLFVQNKVKPTKIKWSKKIYTRKKFFEMMEIKISSKRIKKQINSFYTKNYKSLFIKYNKKKYYLKNLDDN